MKNFKKKVTIVMCLITALCLMVGTFAVFTDRYQASSTVTAGTLDLTLTENWETENANAIASFKPGSALTMSYTLDNAGNMAASVRQNFIITATKDGAAKNFSTIPEFTMYSSGITVDAEGNVTAIAADAKKASVTVDGNTISFAPDEFKLNGTGTGSQATVTDGVDSYTGTYYLVFNENVTNDFQEISIEIEYLAQAIQANNTGENTWKDAQVITDSITFGGEEINVVPQLAAN